MKGMHGWFLERPRWLQEAAQILFETNAELTERDIKKLTESCKSEAKSLENGSNHKPLSLPHEMFEPPDKKQAVRLISIGEISNINALAPRKPLEFRDKPLTIIFGENGTGKSGYVRILKHTCGAKAQGELYGNIFSESINKQSCKIKFMINNQEKNIKWFPENGIIEDLRGIEIYDIHCGSVYIDKEYEVTYEPPIIHLLKLLVNACNSVGELLQSEIDRKISSLPRLPDIYKNTKAGLWLKNIDERTSSDNIVSQCRWDKDDKYQLNNINRILLQNDPQGKIQDIKKKEKHLLDFIQLLKNTASSFSDRSFENFLSLRQEAGYKRRAATEDAKRVFDNAPLEGIGSESWRLLWKQARRYSTEKAYISEDFPFLDEGSLCVLCQQPLDNKAKRRMENFEKFVKGSLEKEASEAEKSLEFFTHQLPDFSAFNSLDATLGTSGITDESLQKDIHKFIEILKSRKQKFLNSESASELPGIPFFQLHTRLKNLMSDLEKDRTVYEKNMQTDQRQKLMQEKNELEARKWLSEQISSIKSEVERKRDIAILNEAKKKTSTQALTMKVSDLSKKLITEEFKRCFQNELKELGAKNIKVSIEKTGATKGTVWHKIVLHAVSSQQENPTDILSEGELRIISLAAFLAELMIFDQNHPVVFDDPTSSLDQIYEEKVARRISKLSKYRQVIVYTHRLSFLYELGENSDSDIISLCRDAKHIGDPEDMPIRDVRPKNALKTSIDHYIPRIKKLYEESFSDYNSNVESLCKNIRIILEKIVEKDLLADIVNRFRRAIHTQGKLYKIACVSKEDCAFIDNMMTKYSGYMHASPEDAPVRFPDPDELEEDLVNIKDWLKEFSDRVENCDK